MHLQGGRAVLKVHGDQVVCQLLVVLGCGAVQHQVDEVEAGQQGGRQVDVVDHAQPRVVP